MLQPRPLRLPPQQSKRLPEKHLRAVPLATPGRRDALWVPSSGATIPYSARLRVHWQKCQNPDYDRFVEKTIAAVFCIEERFMMRLQTAFRAWEYRLQALQSALDI